MAALMHSTISFRGSVLPWELSPRDEARFRRIFGLVLLLAFALGIGTRLLPHPEAAAETAVTAPPPIARLLLEERPAPPPPAPPPRPPETAPPVTTAEPRPTPAPVVPSARAVVEAHRPVPGRPPGEAVDRARAQAAGVGLLAMKDTLAEMHAAPAAVQLNQDIRPGPGVGSGVGVGVGAGHEAGLPDRRMITSNATGGSGGINTAGLSRDTGGGGLAGRATTLVAGVAGGGGGGPGASTHGRGTGTGAGRGAGDGVQRGSGGRASRSEEEVRLVLERNKSALYSIYNRALREDPTLQGKVVVRFTIAASGAITACRIESSELKSPELEQKLLTRFRMLEFKAEDVGELNTHYELDFLPS